MSDIWNQPCNTEYSFPHSCNPYHFLQGSAPGLMWGPINPNINHNIQLTLPELSIQHEQKMRNVPPPQTTTQNPNARMRRGGRQMR
jgi:hypothetical protein